MSGVASKSVLGILGKLWISARYIVPWGAKTIRGMSPRFWATSQTVFSHMAMSTISKPSGLAFFRSSKKVLTPALSCSGASRISRSTLSLSARFGEPAYSLLDAPRHRRLRRANSS